MLLLSRIALFMPWLALSFRRMQIIVPSKLLMLEAIGGCIQQLLFGLVSFAQTAKPSNLNASFTVYACFKRDYCGKSVP